MNPFDDRYYEPSSTDLPEGCVYCTSCGTIYIWTKGRDCPTCALAEAIEDLQETHR